MSGFLPRARLARTLGAEELYVCICIYKMSRRAGERIWWYKPRKRIRDRLNRDGTNTKAWTEMAQTHSLATYLQRIYSCTPSHSTLLHSCTSTLYTPAHHILCAPTTIPTLQHQPLHTYTNLHTTHIPTLQIPLHPTHLPNICWRHYCNWIWLIVLRAFWRRKRYSIAPKTCNSGTLHNHHSKCISISE